MINLCGTCPLKGNFDMVEIQNLGNLFKIGKYIKCSLSSDIAVWVEKQHKPKSKRSQISKSHLKKKIPGVVGERHLYQPQNLYQK